MGDPLQSPNRHTAIKVFCIGIMSALCNACEKVVDGRRHAISCDVSHTVTDDSIGFVGRVFIYFAMIGF